VVKVTLMEQLERDAIFRDLVSDDRKLWPFLRGLARWKFARVFADPNFASLRDDEKIRFARYPEMCRRLASVLVGRGVGAGRALDVCGDFGKMASLMIMFVALSQVGVDDVLSDGDVLQGALNEVSSSSGRGMTPDKERGDEFEAIVRRCFRCVGDRLGRPHHAVGAEVAFMFGVVGRMPLPGGGILRVSGRWTLSQLLVS
jgi:hypothetical protein